MGITFNRGDGMGKPAAALFDHRMIAGTARGDLLDRLLDRYRGLAADAKTALRLKAMIGSDNNKSLFVACMAATGTRGPDGRTWSFKTVNQVLEQLRSKGLVSDSTSCVAQLLHPVTADAMAATPQPRPQGQQRHIAGHEARDQQHWRRIGQPTRSLRSGARGRKDR